MLNIESKVTLSNGVQMPLLGFGTWQIKDGKDAYDAVSYALKFGYRHIDTAAIYGNEKSVGQAIRDSGVPRDQIWVTTKLWLADFSHVEAALDASLRKLGLEYVDLYLVHWPMPGMTKKAWKGMEKVYTTGKTKSVGVSNFSVRNLKAVSSGATIKPMVNQVKCSPYNYSPTLHEYCNQNGIIMEAYSPLTRGKKLGDPFLVDLAQKYSATPAHILLRWCIQKGIPAIPKSVHKQRIAKNADIFDFEISDIDMLRLDNIRKRKI